VSQKEVAEMTAAMTTLTEWQDKYISFVTRVQEPVVEYTGRFADRVAPYVPERPDWSFLDRVPTMTDVVDNQLKFRKRMVDEQAAFVRKMMRAMRPALVKVETKPMTPKTTPATSRRRVGVRAA
jgi:hypothetical protein